MLRRNELGLCALVVASAASVAASSGTLMAPADPMPAGKNAVGVREVVRLSGRTGVLTGTPSSTPIDRIVIRTPGSNSVSSLVLWHRAHADRSVMFHVSAPSELANQLRGMTVFFRSSTPDTRIYEARDGQWVRRQLEELTLGTGQDGSRTVLGVSFEFPGTFLLAPAVPTAGNTLPRTAPGAFDVSTRIARAGWHLVLPAVVFGVIRLVSRRRHSVSRER